MEALVAPSVAAVGLATGRQPHRALGKGTDHAREYSGPDAGNNGPKYLRRKGRCRNVGQTLGMRRLSVRCAEPSTAPGVVAIGRTAETTLAAGGV